MAAKNYRGYVQHSSFFQMKRNWQNLKVKQKILGSDTRLDTISAFVQGGALRAPPMFSVKGRPNINFFAQWEMGI